MNDLLGYKNQKVVITGCASGMGAAAAQMLIDCGAEVYGLDVSDIDLAIHKALRVDLSDKGSIDAAIAELPDEIYAVFNCAGVAHPPAPADKTLLINFVGMRHLTEALLPRMSKGGGIASIASTAGMAWQANLEKIDECLALADFDSAAAWVATEPTLGSADPYGFSKQCMIVYSMRKAGELAKQHIRINTIAPSPTETNFMVDLNSAGISKDITQMFTPASGEFAAGEDMGAALVMLNSKLGRFVSGVNLPVDYGYCAEVWMGQRDNLMGI